VAAEYVGLSEDTTSPFLRAYYSRIAEEYLVRSDGELRALRREQITVLASAADMPSQPGQPKLQKVSAPMPILL
jgi:hypothetical protein